MSPADDLLRAESRDGADRTSVDSRWWYVLALNPVVLLLGVVLALGVAAALLTAPDPTAPVPPALLYGLVGYALLGGLVLVLTPIAFYLDASRVAAAGLEWEPDPVLWVTIGVVGIFVSMVGAGGAVYYLYRRHEQLGVP